MINDKLVFREDKYLWEMKSWLVTD